MANYVDNDIMFLDPEAAAKNKAAAVNLQKYLIFMVHDEGAADLKFGINADFVVEILNSYTVTYLPMMPSYLRGVFNMRGQITPIMDFRLRLDKVPTTDGLLLILNYNDMQLGVLVDAVDRMIDIDENTITPVPAQSSQRFVSGMCTIPDLSGTMMVLSCEQLFAHE